MIIELFSNIRLKHLYPSPQKVYTWNSSLYGIMSINFPYVLNHIPTEQVIRMTRAGEGPLNLQRNAEGIFVAVWPGAIRGWGEACVKLLGRRK